MDLERYCKMRKRIAVAYSGEIDSIYLAHMIAKYADVAVYFVKTELQTEYSIEDAKAAAAFSNIPLKVIETSIIDNPAITANDSNMCYHYKKAILMKVVEAAEEDGFNVIADGTNASDEDEPGMRALKEMGIESPLRICALTKADVRRAAREEGIPFWDKHSDGCLATRLRKGTPISQRFIWDITEVENYLHNEGFTGYRVVVAGDIARLQLKAEEFGKFFRNRDAIASKILEHFAGADLDLVPRVDPSVEESLTEVVPEKTTLEIIKDNAVSDEEFKALKAAEEEKAAGAENKEEKTEEVASGSEAKEEAEEKAAEPENKEEKAGEKASESETKEEAEEKASGSENKEEEEKASVADDKEEKEAVATEENDKSSESADKFEEEVSDKSEEASDKAEDKKESDEEKRSDTSEEKESEEEKKPVYTGALKEENGDYKMNTRKWDEYEEQMNKSKTHTEYDIMYLAGLGVDN